MTALELLDRPAPAPRTDVWSVNNPHGRVHYRLVAEVEADILCRVLNLFALQLLTPQQVSAQQQDDQWLIEVQLDGLSWHRAELIAQKMRNLISVCSVALEQVPTLELPRPVHAAQSLHVFG